MLNASNIVLGSCLTKWKWNLLKGCHKIMHFQHFLQSTPYHMKLVEGLPYNESCISFKELVHKIQVLTEHPHSIAMYSHGRPVPATSSSPKQIVSTSFNLYESTQDSKFKLLDLSLNSIQVLSHHHPEGQLHFPRWLVVQIHLP